MTRATAVPARSLVLVRSTAHVRSCTFGGVVTVAAFLALVPSPFVVTAAGAATGAAVAAAAGAAAASATGADGAATPGAAAAKGATTAAGEIVVRDDGGNEVRLGGPARRIVSLSPHATELLFAAGAGERVVGAVDFSDYPAEAARIPRVGSSRALDIERIARLQPDLVVGWTSGNGERQLQALRRLGLAVFESEPQRLDDIPATIETLGRLAGTVPVAVVAARAFRADRQVLAARYSGRSPVTVFHQVWSSPLLTINRHHVINDVIELCGGRNVFADLPALTPTVSVEAVVRANPEVITTAAVTGEERDALQAWKRWPQITAVARGALVVIDPDHLSRHTPRILLGAARLCDALDAARARRK